ncbi:MAG: hypothetical protein JO110_21200 [Acetobacteraceae bacterium]|nr:hypothetical protein [Acetobacteraceae bacterium]
MAQPTTAKSDTSPSAGLEPSAPAALERPQPAIRYVDRPDMAETFVDSITGLVFDGQTLRIEFGVTRLDEVKANSQITGRRYPACRLVLPAAAAADLITRMQQTGAAIAQARAARAAPRSGETEPAATDPSHQSA